MSRAHIINRVALRGIGDPAAGRAWTRRALEPADLDGIVPPAATLVLRSVALGGRRPDAALRRAAHDAVRTAARPAAGPVGASAEAVLFADDAELLGCMFRDLLDGTFARAWWWAGHRRARGGPAAVVARACVERVRAVPAALDALARTGQAGAALATLPEPAVRELAAAAVTAGVLAPAVAARAFASPATHDDPRAQVEARRAVADGPASILGAALLLAHRSPVARPDEVIAAVADTRDARARDVAQLAPATTSDAAVPVVAPAPSHRAATPAPALPVPREPDSVKSSPGTAKSPPPAADAPGRPRTRIVPAASPAAERPPGAAGDARRAVPCAPTAGAARRAAPAAPAPELSAPAPAGVVTSLAGAFLLLTVARDLGLYPDFTRPRDRGLPMSPWTWLAHTTAQLVGVRDDPLWALLAELADEPDAPPPGQAPALRTTTRRMARRLDGALGRRKSARWVIVRRGTVHAGPARVDVIFALDDLDFAIRLCGLDSDPGWLPAAARDVRLHYR